MRAPQCTVVDSSSAVLWSKCNVAHMYLKHCVHRLLEGAGSKYFKDEIVDGLKHAGRGTVAMASGGPDQNGSQFYITTRDNIDYLDGQHTVFGEVVEGLDVLSKINESIVDDKFRPWLDIRCVSRGSTCLACPSSLPALKRLANHACAVVSLTCFPCPRPESSTRTSWTTRLTTRQGSSSHLRPQCAIGPRKRCSLVHMR